MAASKDHPHEFACGDSFDWSTYLAARPVYTESNFYDQIFAYHKSRGNGWTLAHDVGTGPGNVAHDLSHHFDHIQASDPSIAHFDEAKHRLGDRNVTIVESRGETLLEKTDAELHGKADLVAVAETIALMEPVRALENFAGLLKPGGTLAVWFYGRPVFEDKKNEAREQEVFDRILTIAWSSLKPFNVVLEHTWDDVRRTKWNTDKPMTFMPEEHLGFEVDSKSAIYAHEAVEERIDPGFWAKKDVGIEWVKNFVEHQWPWKEKWEGLRKELDPLFDELEEAMGGPGAKTTISWPVVLMLASRK